MAEFLFDSYGSKWFKLFLLFWCFLILKYPFLDIWSLLLIFVILSRMRCSLTMMFDWSFSLTMLSLLVRHDIKLDVREDGKLLPHVKWICFSDGVYKTCLSSSIVDCDSKGSRRFSIKCFGSLLNEVDDTPSFGSSWPCGGYFGSSVVDRFVLSDFRYSHITIHPRPSLYSHISPI